LRIYARRMMISACARETDQPVQGHCQVTADETGFARRTHWRYDVTLSADRRQKFTPPDPSRQNYLSRMIIQCELDIKACSCRADWTVL